jgi:hypothetical protein
MKRLIAFGDSFIFGSELSDQSATNIIPSKLTWPALLAQQFNLDYSCMARPSASNAEILRRLLHYSKFLTAEDTVVIGWTYMERTEFYNERINEKDVQTTFSVFGGEDDYKWIPVTPSMAFKSPVLKDYYTQFFTAETPMKYLALQQVGTAKMILDNIGCKYIMTHMSEPLWDQHWHAPSYVQALQDLLLPSISTFNGKNFYSLASNNNLPIGVSDHPLEATHKLAAELMSQLLV